MCSTKIFLAMIFNEIKCHVNTSLVLVGGCIPCILPVSAPRNCLYFIVFLTWKFPVFWIFLFACSNQFALSNKYEHAKIQLLLMKLNTRKLNTIVFFREKIYLELQRCRFRNLRSSRYNSLLSKASISITDRKINCTEIYSTGSNLRIGKKQ